MPINSQLTARLATTLRIIHRVEDSLLAVMLLTMILLATAQIFLRNLFDLGLTWEDPLLRIMLLWLGLLGALAASRDNKHITIDILTRLVHKRARNVVQIITSLFTAIVTAIIAWHALRFVIMEYHTQNLAVGGIAAWIFESIIPFAFTLISIRYLIHFGQHVITLSHRSETQ